MTSDTISEAMSEMDWLKSVLAAIAQRNDTDLSSPRLRSSFVGIYPVFVLLYAALVVVGTVLNAIFLGCVVMRKLYHEPTACLLANLAAAHILECVFSLPFTLAVLMVQNWIFGSFLCYFLPMIQDIPIHVQTLTYLLIAIDRYLFLRAPTKPRLPAFVCAFGTWLTGMCVALPHPLYTTYIDMGEFTGSKTTGIGVCLANLREDMKDYIRGVFLVVYLAPLASVVYFNVLTSQELKRQEEPAAIVTYEVRSRQRSRSTRSSSAGSSITHSTFRYRDENQYCSYRPRCDRVGQYADYDVELDIPKEKKTQKYLMFITVIYGICLFPLMLLRLLKLALNETYENAARFDITYTMTVWFAFLPTCSTPIVVGSLLLSRSEKERLRGFFRISNRSRVSGDASDHSGPSPTSEMAEEKPLETFAAPRQLIPRPNDPNEPPRSFVPHNLTMAPPPVVQQPPVLLLQAHDTDAGADADIEQSTATPSSTSTPDESPPAQRRKSSGSKTLPLLQENVLKHDLLEESKALLPSLQQLPRQPLAQQHLHRHNRHSMRDHLSSASSSASSRKHYPPYSASINNPFVQPDFNPIVCDPYPAAVFHNADSLLRNSAR